MASTAGRVVWFHRSRAIAWAVVGALSFLFGWQNSVVLVWIASLYANISTDWGNGEAADDHKVIDRLERIESLLRGRHHTMFRVKVIPDNGEPFELKTSTRDIAQWEKRNKGASFAGLQADMHMSDLYKVTHIAAVRQGVYTGTLKDFEDSVDLDILGDEDPDPTQSEATAAV